MHTLFRIDRRDQPLTTLRRLVITLTLLFGALAGSVLGVAPASAQTPEAPASELNLNAYHCPADYDQVSDCTKLDGVSVDVTQDGQPLGQVVSKASEGATLDLMFGAFIELSVVSGAPEGTVLEQSTLSFDAVEGQNAVTLVFVDQEPPHSDTNALVVEALVCPVEYDGNNYAADCDGEDGIGVTVTRDADDFTVEGETDADGVVGFQGLGEGTYTVELGVPGDFADFLTVCGVRGEAEPREVTNPDTNRLGVYLGPTDKITCTFFIVPVDAVGDTDPTPTPVSTVAPVTSLPSTGSGSTTSGGFFMVAGMSLLGASVLLTLAWTRAVRRERI